MTASTIRGLIDLSGDTYSAYRQMRERVRQTATTEKRLPSARTPKESEVMTRPISDAVTNAVSGLINLGFRRPEAEAAIAAVERDARTAVDVPQLIKLGLKVLAKH
jgi:Holliday junction DNA helicase RuvA